MSVLPSPLPSGVNKSWYFDLNGQLQIEDNIKDAVANFGITAAVAGDLTAVFTQQQFNYDKRGKYVDLFGALSFTPTYTITAWAASTAYAVGIRRTNGGNTYEVTTAGTSAASGGPTGTGASITDGSVVWKYVSAATSGQFMITGLPFAADAGLFRQYLSCVPLAPVTFPNNGTALYASPNLGLTNMALFASKSAGGAQSSQMSATQIASGTAYSFAISGRYRAVA